MLCKETWQLSAIGDSGLDLVVEGKAAKGSAKTVDKSWTIENKLKNGKLAEIDDY